MIAFSAKTVNPLHPGVTIQQNDDKVEGALRALAFGKIGQHRWALDSLWLDLPRHRDESPDDEVQKGPIENLHDSGQTSPVEIEMTRDQRADTVELHVRPPMVPVP